MAGGEEGSWIFISFLTPKYNPDVTNLHVKKKTKNNPWRNLG